MSDDIIIPRSELEGALTPRWSDLSGDDALGERLACNVPNYQSLAEWHYKKALESLAAAVEMKRLGY